VTAKTFRIAAVLFVLLLFALGCSRPHGMSLWERHCAACHDGKTVLDGKVVPSREQIKEKYKTLDEFAGACSNLPSCMNIVKHEKGLLLEVGSEIGLKPARKR
jgi:hypothetical protein